MDKPSTAVLILDTNQNGPDSTLENGVFLSFNCHLIIFDVFHLNASLVLGGDIFKSFHTNHGGRCWLTSPFGFRCFVAPHQIALNHTLY